MADYLHPGKTTTGQYYAELTVKLLDIIKQKYCRKLLLRSVTFSRQCTTTRITGCSASCLRLWICSTDPFCLQSTLGSQRLFPNEKSELPSSWNLVHSWWIIDDRYVEAWLKVKTKKNSYFQCLSNWEDVAGKYVEKLQYIWYNILIFIAKLQNFLIAPRAWTDIDSFGQKCCYPCIRMNWIVNCPIMK